MSIRLAGSSSGYTELDAGAVAGNNTLKMPVSNGAANQLLRNGATPGTLEFGGAIVSGTAQASTSGTSIDFTGIPSWVKRVTVMLDGVSTSGTSALQIQIGSGSIDATGYTSRVYAVSTNTATSTTGILFIDTAAVAATYTSSMQLVALGSGNTWIATGLTLDSVSPASYRSVARKSLSGTLGRIRITTVNGTDQFDAGTINILYE